jgi:type IV pilus assembly protein PilV
MMTNLKLLKQTSKHMKLQKHNNGFTLVEILITVLILSIGLLGLAGLQVNSMKSNHSSYLRTQATIMAYDIIDRMRANPTAVTAGDYEAKGAYTVTTSSTPYTVNAPTATAGCSTTTGCTTTQMANTDINQWRVDLATQLPGGVGIVCQDGTRDPVTDTGTDPATHGCDTPNGVYAIKIWWSDDRTGTLKRFITSYAP